MEMSSQHLLINPSVQIQKFLQTFLFPSHHSLKKAAETDLGLLQHPRWRAL